MTVSVISWHEVSQDEFYSAMGRQNVRPYPIGNWPYTSLFKTPQGAVLGKAVKYYPEGSALTKTRYMLPNH